MKKYIFKHDTILTHYNDIYPEFGNLLQRHIFCKAGMVVSGTTEYCVNDYVRLRVPTQEGIIECACKNALLQEYVGERECSNFIVELKNKVIPTKNCYCKYCEKQTLGYTDGITYNCADIGTKFLCNNCKKVSLTQLKISKAKILGIMLLNKTGLDIFTGNIKSGPISRMDYYLITGGKQLGKNYIQIKQ